MESKQNTTQARLATLEQLIASTVKVYLSPPPSKDTLRKWLDDARIPRFKANPMATRGGGPVWYSVPAVEKMLRERTLVGAA